MIKFDESSKVKIEIYKKEVWFYKNLIVWERVYL